MDSLRDSLLRQGQLTAPEDTEAADNLRALYRTMRQEGHALAFQATAQAGHTLSVTVYHYLSCELCHKEGSHG